MRVSEPTGRNAHEHQASPETKRCGRRAGINTAKAATGQYASERNAVRVHRGTDDGMWARGVLSQHGRSRPVRRPKAVQPTAREGRAGLGGESERPILPKKPGNAG